MSADIVAVSCTAAIYNLQLGKTHLRKGILCLICRHCISSAKNI